MNRVAYLCSADVLPGAPNRREDAFEVDHQLAALVGPCADLGIELVPVAWDAPLPSGAIAAVVGPTWDYAERPEVFLGRLEAIRARMPLWNDLEILRWNLDKRYLRDLEQRGIPILPTSWAQAATDEAIREAEHRFGTDDLVIKPVVGAGASEQIRLPQDAARPRPRGPVMIQPFQPSIQTHGELGVLCFGGEVSHGVRKRAVPGDYRVQSLYGGFEHAEAPDEASCALVGAVLQTLPSELLYARVDLVLDAAGSPCVIELELIEPYLYPEQSEGCGQLFGRTLRRLLDRQGLAGV